MDQPLVSIVMGTYNGKRHLQAQVDSILAQSYPHIELIISDDASEDGTAGLLKQYEADPRVRIFYQQKNLGLPANYSFAASKAGGALIAFADQDDIWKNKKIEKLVNAIGQYPLVYSDSILIDEEGQPFGINLSDWKKMYSGNDSRGYFLYSCVWGHGMMVKKELLEKCLPIPSTVHHDIWIAFQAFIHGGIKYLDEALTFYRQSPGKHSLSFKNGLARQYRQEQYLKKLNWLSLMKEHERPEYRDFYNQLFKLYEKKSRNGYVFPLVPFMLKHRKSIFSLSRKSFASQFIEILKQARSEKL
jgi:glycosyltransferase involved in cell wall biosynthesis